MRRQPALFLLLLALALCAVPCAAQAPGAWGDGTPILRFDKRTGDAAAEMTLAADWTNAPPRHWAGPTIWCNRLQDWQTAAGVLTCTSALPARTAHLLTHELVASGEPFRLEVVLRMPAAGPEGSFAGFLVGAGEGRLRWPQQALVHHLPGHGGGLLAVVETHGEGGLAFRDMSRPETRLDYPLLAGQQTLASAPIRLEYHRMMLNLEGVPAGADAYDLRLSVWAEHAGELLGAQELRGVPSARLLGGVALVSTTAGGPPHHFEALKVGGGRLQAHPERTFGPVAGTLYSLADGTLKLGAQLVHLGEGDLPADDDSPRRGRPFVSARLEVRPVGGEGEWQVADGIHPVSPPDYYTLFRVEGWDGARDWDGRVVVTLEDGEHVYPVRIRREPTEQAVVSVAGFTGMGQMGRTANAAGPQPEAGEAVLGRWTPANVWWPFGQAVDALQNQNVDLLCFTGDQIYEGKPTPPDPVREPYNDYLYKWLLWHWAFGPLTRQMPATVQPDDHDVYHGNLWGWSGRLAERNNVNIGGYVKSPYFVNAVHRTQTGHMPDAFEPRPALNGISNYYCGFTYGGIGFAVLEDRKFKTPPQVDDPAAQQLLGERQLEFLRQWAADREGQAFKVVVSQTIYASLHVDFDGNITSDKDTNGWPVDRRDEAVRLFRDAGALVLSGDQHLATMARVGLDEPEDGVYQFCVPALANIFWRWFYPNQPGEERRPGEPPYLGEFLDGFGNPFRMIAVANPEVDALLSQRLRQRFVLPADEAGGVVDDGTGVAVAVRTDRASLGDGYGIVRFNKADGAAVIECWPHNVDPAAGGQQFAGWPIRLESRDLRR